jgi:signal transduction histidine kinase/DNA-binding response OmpR family regulator
MKKNYYFIFKLLSLFLLCLISCNSKIEDQLITSSVILKDSINSEEFSYNEFEQKWKLISLKNKNSDSLLQKITLLNNEGDKFRDKSLFKDALNTHFKALQLAEEINDTLGIITALNNIGTDLRRTSSNIEATEYHYRAFELASFNPENLKPKAIAMNGLGNVFLELHKPDEAAKYFEKSLKIEKQLHSNLGQAINYANFGDVMKMKSDLNSALSYYNKSLEQNLIINSNLGIAICKNAIGSIYLLQNNTSNGLKLIREAVTILQDSPDAFHKLEMQISLCKSLIDLNQLSESKTLLNEIFKTSKSVNSYSSNQTAYELQTLLSKKQQDYKAALAAKEIAISYRDSTLALNNEVKILEIENKYKTKQALQQIKFLIKEKALIESTNTNQQRIFLLLFLFMSSIIGFTYYMYRNRKHVNLELKKMNEMKSRFFGNVSHEFRTPLTLIKGPLEKMLQSKLSKTQKEAIELMHRNTDRLLYLVNQILNLSKIDAGKFQIKAQKGNLSNEIKGISQSFEYIANTKKLNYTIAISESKNVWFDTEILEMLLTNVLSNAFKFTPENGSISIKGIPKKDNYTIYISNTVAQITSSEINHFFDRFYTNATSTQQGTGIGLSLVKELCTLYRATISVNKKNDFTIEFEIVLPTSINHFKSQEISTAPNFSIEESNTLDDFNLENENVIKNSILLIVEDNKDMRSYITSIFKNQYQIIEAKDGEEGVNLAQKNIPDIIISDIMMPKLTGIQLCNQLKTNPNTNHIPIILLTAVTEEEMMIKGLNEMADDYITKPFGIKLLKTKVTNLINIRKTLANKFREEIVLKPLNQLLKWGNNSFSDTLKKVLENDITNPNFGIEEFCNAASMSRTQLHRKLKATTGMSATEFIRVHRVKNAAELLKNKELAISEICFACGFESTSYFSKQFKIVFGCSPKDYRKNTLK